MITAGMTFSRPDGSIATVLANKFSGWNLSLDTDNVITGLTDAQVEQEMAAYRMAQARAAETKRMELAALAREIDAAHEAALLYDAKFNAKRDKVRKASALFVPGQPYKRYSPQGIAKLNIPPALLAIIEAHYSAIVAVIKAENMPRFIANLQDAGHAYKDGMPGLQLAGEGQWGDTLVIKLPGDVVPDDMLIEIAQLQFKCGIRAHEDTVVENGIHCNCLAWYLIRKGAALGPRG